MAGTPDGAKKAVARSHGMTVDVLKAKLASGVAWCNICKKWQARDEFSSDPSRSDGLARACRDSKNKKAKRLYTKKPRANGRRFVDARNGDREQARGRVNHLVRIGRLPSPKSLPCSDCGDTDGSSGRHEYDHYNGYEKEHHETVQAVCARCHARRSHERGEIEHRRGRDGRFRNHG